jgi:hypothetical protein
MQDDSAAHCRNGLHAACSSWLGLCMQQCPAARSSLPASLSAEASTSGPCSLYHSIDEGRIAL